MSLSCNFPMLTALQVDMYRNRPDNTEHENDLLPVNNEQQSAMGALSSVKFSLWLQASHAQSSS